MEASIVSKINQIGGDLAAFAAVISGSQATG
jgi:hypothetical protein